jgi:fructokinase
MKVLIFGEILWDIIEGKKHLGGAPLNFAAHAFQCGEKSGIISSLGQDDLGNEALRLVNDLNVNTDLVQRTDKYNTGTVLVTLDNGQPDYKIKTSVAYDFISVEKLNRGLINQYDAFYFGSLIQRNKVSQRTLYEVLENFTFDKIFYDVNLRKDCYSKDIIEKSLSYCTMLKVNDDEVTVISNMLYGQFLDFESFSKEIIKNYPQIELVIVTAGKEGCCVFHQGKLLTVPGIPIDVKDTVGAGDSFSAAFLCAYNKTNDPMQAATVANHVGAFVASSSGPIPNFAKEVGALFV